uniref:uncharacterized protein LOC100187054 n=1 Tax=Ciona intestinalis TaxID=7719 RepID=UPI000180C1D3|nr:uncharacterized protein LOC100187054 [Ciona intestinalis]|eukprot:XP_002130033.1 uncharacterized protein LOC100187054 [Ciona intestinalis]
MMTEKLQKRRFSYLTKLIVDEDIPLEDLHNLEIPNVGCGGKQQGVEINSNIMDSVKPLGTSEFHSEAYLEYRRRVFEQLAEEYEREKQQKQEVEIHNDQPFNQTNNQSNDVLHSSCEDDQTDENEDLLKLSPDLQPAWDDSDLKSHAYISSPHQDVTNGLWQKQEDFSDLISTDNFQESTDNSVGYNLNDWTMFDAQIQKATKAASNEQLKTGTLPKTLSPVLPPQRRRTSKNSFKRSSLKDKDGLQRKISLDEMDEDDGMQSSHKSWLNKKSYSTQNQSLQICYINEPCSSDESDSTQQSSDKANHNETPQKSPSSPTLSPGFTSSKGYGKRYLRRNRLSNASSHSSHSSSSSLSFSHNTCENTIIHHHNDLRSGRTRQEDLEIEARFQLAEAQQKAKLEAEEFRKQSKTKDASLLTTLSDELQRKMNNFGLNAKDCQLIKLKQLRQMLKELHMKQQVLSESLVSLLLERDTLQTAQDAKLTDIEDIKCMMSTLGPETTV